jgi:hypothetical protein
MKEVKFNTISNDDWIKSLKEARSTPNAVLEDIVRIHQYLKHVASKPLISDHEFSMLCIRAGIEGGGGSDKKEDYPAKTIESAEKIMQRLHPNDPYERQ